MKHYTVLKKECIDGLNIKPDGIYVDGTLGYAGDSSEILKRIKNGKLIAFDRDKEAINYSNEVLKNISNSYQIFHDKFSNMKQCLESIGITKVDGILFDFGVSSPQLDEKRGFSFMRDEVLDMRMNQEDYLTAENVVNEYSEEKLKEIFYKYGEEKRSAQIAKKIVEIRKQKAIHTTREEIYFKQFELK